MAPCPGEEECPIVSDWCHFTQRLTRTPLQRRLRSASLPWEDAKYSFVIVARFPSPSPPRARVLTPPRRSKGLVTLDLCFDGERRTVRVAKSKGEAYRDAKDLSWGAAVERELQIAIALQLAETVGAIDRIFELTLEWMFDRHSFGRPLASYQALKHRFADMKLYLEASQAAATAVARAVQHRDPEAPEKVSAAKSYPRV